MAQVSPRMRRVRRRASVVVAGAIAALPPLSAQQPATPRAAESRPAIVLQGQVDSRKDVNFSAMAVPSTVYVGQQVTYQIGVFLSEDVSQRLRRNPEFVPPDVRSMLAYDLPSPARPLLRDAGGRTFAVHVFQRALFPLTAGTHTLAPARLTYSLPLSNTFFSREESHSARTSAVTVFAKEPPTAGRPDGYTGAVGRLAVSARIDSPTTRVGDPVTLVVSVRGTGNVSLFPPPRVAIPWGDVVKGAERVTIDSGIALVQGRKDFEWVVTPKREGTLEVPALRYPYWNPYTERYEVAVTAPLSVQVGAGSLAARVAVVADTVPRLPLRVRYRGALSVPRSSSPAWWALLGIFPLPALMLGARHRPRRARAERRDRELQRLAASGRATPAELRRAFTAAITTRTGCGGRAMTETRALVRALRHAGVTTATAERAVLVLGEIDRATYGGDGRSPAPDLALRAADTFAAIDAEAIPFGLPHPRPAAHAAALHGRGLALLAAAFTFGTVSAIAATDDEAQEVARFTRGTAHYNRGEYEAAMHEFRDIVIRVPRAADAWANLGTSAWYANDTATAAIGWQRALRLEPLAGDLRGRLESIPGFRSGVLGDIPPVPVDVAAALGTLLWIVGWGGLAWTLARRRGDLRRMAIGAIGGSALIGVMTVALAETISGRHHVVVVHPERLRSSPALGAEESSEVMTGEGAVETAAQGVWSRLRFADGRVGWMESRRLASLDLSQRP